MMRYYITVLGVLLLMVANFSLEAETSQGEVASNKKGQTMEEKYEAVARRLDTAERSSEFFYQIGKEINSLPPAPKRDPEWRKWRRAKLDLWLVALDLIDRTKDPTFNADDVPQTNVAPPPGTTASAGASPSAIKDPKLRREYEQAIKRNAEKAERYLLQDGIRKLDTQWTESVRVYISGQYTAEPQDVSEIKTLIDGRLSRDSRRDQIRSFILPRGTPQR